MIEERLRDIIDNNNEVIRSLQLRVLAHEGNIKSEQPFYTFIFDNYRDGMCVGEMCWERAIKVIEELESRVKDLEEQHEEGRDWR